MCGYSAPARKKVEVSVDGDAEAPIPQQKTIQRAGEDRDSGLADVRQFGRRLDGTAGILVAKGGIEPPTQGFSVLCSTN